MNGNTTWRASILSFGIAVSLAGTAVVGQQMSSATRNQITAEFLAADDAFEAKKYDTAWTKLEMVRRLNPGEPIPTAQDLRVQVLIAQKRWDDANSELRRLQDLDLSSSPFILRAISGYNTKIEQGTAAERERIARAKRAQAARDLAELEQVQQRERRLERERLAQRHADYRRRLRVFQDNNERGASNLLRYAEQYPNDRYASSARSAVRSWQRSTSMRVSGEHKRAVDRLTLGYTDEANEFIARHPSDPRISRLRAMIASNAQRAASYREFERETQGAFLRAMGGHRFYSKIVLSEEPDQPILLRQNLSIYVDVERPNYRSPEIPSSCETLTMILTYQFFDLEGDQITGLSGYRYSLPVDGGRIVVRLSGTPSIAVYEGSILKRPRMEPDSRVVRTEYDAKNRPTETYSAAFDSSTLGPFPTEYVPIFRPVPNALRIDPADLKGFMLAGQSVMTAEAGKLPIDRSKVRRAFTVLAEKCHVPITFIE